MYHQSVFISLLSTVIFAFSGVFASDKTLKVASFNVPPYVYLDAATNQVHGTLADIVRTRADHCNIAIDYVIAPSWARAYQTAVEGTADALIPTNYTSERAKLFDFAEPSIGEVNASVIVREDSPHEHFTGFHMLDGQHIVKRAKGLLGEQYERYEKLGKMKVVERLTSKDLAEELLSGRVDFIIANYSTIAFHLGEEKIGPRVRVLTPTVGRSVQHLALSKKRAASFAANTEISNCLLGKQ